MAKPLASLSSGLLARPGQAKPAMRRQMFDSGQLEDLGWNDMGHGAPPSPPVAPRPVAAAPAAPVPAAPQPAVEPRVAPIARVATPVAPVEAVLPPPVLAERAKLAGAVAKAKARTRGTTATGATGRKAAFTLRLDADRHLRLRLASAVDGRSSQQLLVEALDAFLNAQPEVEALVRRLPASQRAFAEKR